MRTCRPSTPKTLVIATADLGEMGTAHGGLRQKNFNFDEESIRVPLASHVDLPRPPNHVVSIRERRNKDREYRRLRRKLTYVERTRLKPLG